MCNPAAILRIFKSAKLPAKNLSLCATHAPARQSVLDMPGQFCYSLPYIQNKFYDIYKYTDYK